MDVEKNNGGTNNQYMMIKENTKGSKTASKTVRCYQERLFIRFFSFVWLFAVFLEGGWRTTLLLSVLNLRFYSTSSYAGAGVGDVLKSQTKITGVWSPSCRFKVRYISNSLQRFRALYFQPVPQLIQA